MLRLLETRGHAVVEEAATDVIALANAMGRPEPWREPEDGALVHVLRHDPVDLGR